MEIIVEVTKSEIQKLGFDGQHKLQAYIWKALAEANPKLEKIDCNVTINVTN